MPKSPAIPVVGVQEAATGGVLTRLTWIRLLKVIVSDPNGLEVINSTVKDPELVYVWVGFCKVDELPSPKFHNQEVGVLVDWSKKLTAPLQVEVVLEEKLVIGGLLGSTQENLILGLSDSTPLIQLDVQGDELSLLLYSNVL